MVSKSRKHAERIHHPIRRFGEKMEHASQKFSENMNENFKDSFGRESFWDGFSVIGPIFASLFKLIFFVFALWVLEFVNEFVRIASMSDVLSFLYSNISLFFIIFIFFSYVDYLQKLFPKAYKMLSPIFFAAGFTIALWVIKGTVIASNIATQNEEIDYMTNILQENMKIIFYAILILGYLVLALKMLAKKSINTIKTNNIMAKSKNPAKRLYRSSRERILGGVCGGIAEYLDVDPVLIRLLWVAAILAWGAGIMLYLIAWIVIPRDPKRKWT